MTSTPRRREQARRTPGGLRGERKPRRKGHALCAYRIPTWWSGGALSPWSGAVEVFSTRRRRPKPRHGVGLGELEAGRQQHPRGRRAISVPSTVKWSALIKLTILACSTTARRNSPATSWMMVDDLVWLAVLLRQRREWVRCRRSRRRCRPHETRRRCGSSRGRPRVAWAIAVVGQSWSAQMCAAVHGGGVRDPLGHRHRRDERAARSRDRARPRRQVG